jgi:hypothetical protein
MKLRTLLSTLLLLPAIFLTTDAKAAGHGASLYDLATDITDTLTPAMIGRVVKPDLLQMQINEKSQAFLDAYHREPRAGVKDQGLTTLAAEVGNCAGRLSNFDSQSLQSRVSTLISFLQTNFVDRGIKIRGHGAGGLEHAIARTSATLQPQLQRLVTSNALLP